MNNFDKKIMKLAKQVTFIPGKEYNENIDHLLATLSSNPDFLSKRKSASSSVKFSIAICSLVVLIFASIPVSAKIKSYVKERMESMSDEQLDDYIKAADQNNMTIAHDVEALNYSRKLSEDEQKRYDELFIKYENEGLFPEHELPVVDKVESDAETEYPFYETCSFKYHLPNSTLTDDELLQLIDFSHKLDYATSHTKEAEKILDEQEAFWRNPNPNENDLSQAEAITIATSYLEKILGKDCSRMKTHIEFQFGYGSTTEGYGEYLITFKASDTESYLVSITRETGILSMVYFILNNINYAAYEGTPTPVNEQLFTSRYEAAKAILKSFLAPDISITESSYEYFIDDNGEIEHGYVYYIFTLSDGRVYSIGYNIADDLFPRLYLITSDGNYSALPYETVIPMEP